MTELMALKEEKEKKRKEEEELRKKKEEAEKESIQVYYLQMITKESCLWKAIFAPSSL